MKLIAQVKLDTTPEQHDALKHTLEVANAASNYVSNYAWEHKTFRQFDLHHACYYKVRKQFGVSAQIAVRLIAKVANAYKQDKKTSRAFRSHGAITYDKRILSWRLSDQTISIWTVVGRLHIPFLAGEHQFTMLKTMQGEADLVYRKKAFYLHQTCEVEIPYPDDSDGWLGVDMGIVNIATDSDGETYSGAQINGLRYRYARLRDKLQAKGTKSARRLLKQRRYKESRFAKDVNHCIAKSLVERAKDTGRGIALEDLKGIRERITVHKAQRRQQHSWSFYDLRQKIEYKAAIAGVSVVLVNPRNTSRTCPICGCIDKRNRPTQSIFSCVSCGFSAPADHVAACNIASRAAVNQPNAATLSS